MWLILAFTPAWADFYHPRDVAQASVAYQTASERSAAVASDAQREIRSLSTALAAFEEALDLLGEAAPAEQRSRARELEQKYNRGFAVVQGFADDLVADFDGAFVSALDRALAAHAPAERCERDLPVGPKLPGMAQRRQANAACAGSDLNGALAAMMDADPVLQAELESMLGRSWPSIGLTSKPVAAVGGSRTVQVADFYRAAMPDTLRAIRLADEDARLSFDVAIEGGASKEELADMVEAAKAVDAMTAGKRWAVAGPVHERAQAMFDKRAPDAGWCAQPTVLGGCTGSDDSKALVTLLLADKKVLKALP